MKKLIIVLFCILFTACNKSIVTNISIKNKKINYGDLVYLSDLISISNGKLLSNTRVSMDKLGNNLISFEYIDSNGDKKIYSFNINVVDEEAPKIIGSSNFSTVKGKSIVLTNKILCGDNYDRNIRCNVVGDYDINTIGKYNLVFSSIDSSGNKTEKNFVLTVKEKDSNSENPEYIYFNNIVNKYKNENSMVGIDVSTWQGDIDWNKVKSDGVEFAIIRIGYGYNDNNEMVIDKYFKNNLINAKKAGVKIGIYLYSYASTIKSAKEQANWVIDILDGEKLDLPVAFDWEDWNSFNSYGINFYDLNTIAKTFMDVIISNGYDAMIYGSATYLNNIYKLPEYKTWLAHYTDKTDYDKSYYIWQLGSTGKVNGINSYVDLNVLYKSNSFN